MVDIVGRISQRAQLLRWLTGAIGGQPSVIAIDGPAGVGKSTLVNWLFSQAAERGVTHRQVTVPENGDVTAELGLDAGYVDDLLGTVGPRLLVIDDAQWLDETGQRQIEQLVFRLGTASLTGQPVRLCVVLVVRDEVTSTAIYKRLIDEPITRRLTLDPLDDREAHELARRITPGVTDQRTISRLVALSGGNPLTLNALADAVSVGEVLPSPASTTGTIPVEVAWRARLSTLSDEALRVAVIIALAEQDPSGRRSDDSDVLRGEAGALGELMAVGAVRRTPEGLRFTHPLLRTTALDLVSQDVVAEIAGQLLDRLRRAGLHGSSAATLVRLSAAARCAGTDEHRVLVSEAFDEALGHGSWSAAGDLAEYMVGSAEDDTDRAAWLERLGKARFNELDRDEATSRLIEAAEAYARCAAVAPRELLASGYRNCRAECLLLALRTDFTRDGPRRHAELDSLVGSLIADESIAPLWRARAAAILVEVSSLMPQHEQRQELMRQAEALAAGVDDPLTNTMVHFAMGWHRLATLGLIAANESFTAADQASLAQPDQWWWPGGLGRRALVALAADRPLATLADATVAIERSARIFNWAEHGLALAVHSVANTRLGRFVDADNDTESMMLSARRADSGDPFLIALPAALWRRAARGDEPGVLVLIEAARSHQMFVPFAEFIASSLLHGVDGALESGEPRWVVPRRALEARNLGFHLSQFEAAALAGKLETVDDLFPVIEQVYQTGVRASFDWPSSVALVLAEAAIELGDSSAESWLERARQSAVSAGSVLEQAVVDVQRAKLAFGAGRGGQVELDLARRAIETLDGLGAPLVARLHRERLTAVAGAFGAPAGRIRTVMFTDIVDSTRLMASAGDVAWAMILSEHHRIVRSVVGRFRGSIMTATGDGFSAWFEQAHDAVAAAGALHEAIAHASLQVAGGTVSVRVGLASGSVFDMGGDASGLAVAEAARVMATAGSGETHVSQSTIHHGFDGRLVRSVGVHVLKGLPEPIEIFTVAHDPVGFRYHESESRAL